jgi:glycosyltransferase involved in cell wall biosynthesis
MKVLLSNTMYTGSRYYRVDEPARAVQEADLGLTVVVQRGLETRMVQRPGDDQLTVGSVDAEDADVVVLQLPKTVEMLQCLRLLQAQGVAVVVEMDDLFSAVPFGHPAHRAMTKGGIDKIARAATQEADLVTVSSQALLAQYARHGRGAVVPNAVPRRNAELPPAYEREPETVTIGWSGSVATHPYDLQVMESGLQQALDRTPGKSRFVILGQALDARERLHLPEEPIEYPWVKDVDGYVRSVGELFDIGLAPLRDDQFNASKSWLKVMEYAARGVFAVRSGTAEYELLGLGRRARVPRDWATAITAAVQDPDRRREQAAADREVVLARHLTEHTAERWADAWRQARDNRSRAMRKAG